MACTYLNNLLSVSNAHETLVKEKILYENGSSKILSTLVKFDNTINKMNKDARVNYQVTDSLYSREKRNDEWYAIPNPEAFQKVDNKRKEYGIFDTRESVGSYFNRLRDGLYDNDSDQLNQNPNPDLIPSKSSLDTIKKVKEMLSRMNVNIKDLDPRYGGLNGIAKLSEQVVQIAQGKEDIALTEEGMHFVTAIIKQSDPVLYKTLLNKISSYNTYTKILNSEYAKQYVTKEGKPDIIKLKEEAIGKVLAEYIIQHEEGTTEKPENILQIKSLWQKIVDFLRNIFNKAAINPFEEVVKNLDKLSSDTSDLSGEFSQLNEDDLQNKLVKKIQDYNLTKHEDSSDPDDENRSSYYTVTKDGKDIKTDRTTEYAKRLNITKNGGRDSFKDATKEQISYWSKLAMTGTKGHYDIENIIDASLNSDKTLKSQDQIQLPQTTLLNKGIHDILTGFLLGTDTQEGFLRQFEPGTRFLTEKQIYNEKTNRAGTIDLIVIKPDDSVIIYDWKFMGFSLEKNLDIPKNKRSQHAIQLADYVNTLKKSYGIKDVTAFTIPIHAQYSKVQKNEETVPILTDITIGKVNIKDENRTYLLPVTPEDQSTGVPAVDELIKKLTVQYHKIIRKKVTEDEREARNFDASQISIAIRNLQVRQNFEALSLETNNFKQLVNSTLEKYKDINNNTILDELNSINNSTNTYTGIDAAFISMYGRDNLDEKEQNILNTLQSFSSEANLLKQSIINKIEQVTDTIARTEIGRTILLPEKEVKGLLSQVTVPSLMSHTTANLLTKLLTTARGFEAKRASDKAEQFLELYRKAGDNAYSKITKEGEVKLVDKLSKEFNQQLNKAKEEKTKKFFIQHLNLEVYNKEAQDYVNQQLEKINQREDAGGYNSNPTLNKYDAERYKNQLINSLDIQSSDFNGYTDRKFNSLFKKHIKENVNTLSKEYNAIKSNPDLLNLYNFIRDLNKYAFSLGYLSDQHSLQFLPQVLGNTRERLTQSQHKLQTLKELVQDSYTVQIDEEQEYGKIDPETNEQKKSIPTHFTRINKDFEDLSKDLPKIMIKYIEALEKFSTNQKLEQTALSLLAVEAAKGHLEVNKVNDNVIFDANGPKVFEGNQKNTEVLQNIIDSAIYGIRNDTNTFLDIGLSKLGKSDEASKEQTKLAVKKLIDSSNAYVQALAVGGKLMIAIPKYLGDHFNACINSGRYFTATEYEQNHATMLASFLNSNEKKAAINLFIPLEGDPGKHIRRSEAFKNNKLDYIKTWTFKDVLMSGNRLGEIAHELTNAGVWVDNTIIRDGKFVNIRQWLKQQPDYGNKYTDPSTLKKAEEDFETKVKELQKEAITKIGKFDKDGNFVIPGIDIEKSNYGEYRTKIQEFARKITAQISRENEAQYRKSIIFRSFMMFKNWIVGQVATRASDIYKDDLLDQWSYGRARVYFKVVSHIGLKSIYKIRAIRMGTPEGIKIMRDILQDKKDDYFKKNGKELEISDTEFFDMIRQELTSETKELRIVMTLVAMALSSYALVSKHERDRNKYKSLVKFANKTADELRFYYNPLSIQSVTKGSILPSIGVLAQGETLLRHVGNYTWDEATGNYNDAHKEHPLKYILGTIPGPAQFDTEILPIIDPEAAKHLGIVVSTASRRN